MSGFVRFFNTSIPVNRCNLRCHYCYIGQTGGYGRGGADADESLHYSLSHMKKAFAPERLGGTCLFNLCAAGETTLFGQLPELVAMLLELGHFVSIITNATLKEPLMRLLEIPKVLRERLFMKCSLQYLELKRLGLIEKFFDNIDLIKRHNVSFTVELTANDESIKFIPDIKEVCLRRTGALCHVVESRDEGNPRYPRLTKLPLAEHQSVWGSFESLLFQYEQKTYERYQPKFCYAGEFSCAIELQSGDCYQCNGAKKFANMFESTDTPVSWVGIGENCPLSHCFISYVWSALCNCYGEENTPTYAQERDRVCADNSHWLTVAMRGAFSHRCSEYHELYSPDKAYYIDLLMRKVYKGLAPMEREKKKLARILGKSLIARGFNKVAIYGMGAVGRWLREILRETDVEVSYAIDRNFAKIDCDIPVQSPEKGLPSADAVVVSVYSEFSNIAPLLRMKTDAPVLSVVELAD
jgi:hypothetical protein